MLRDSGDGLYRIVPPPEAPHEGPVVGEHVLPHPPLDGEHLLLDEEQRLCEGGGNVGVVLGVVTELAHSVVDSVGHLACGLEMTIYP